MPLPNTVRPLREPGAYGDNADFLGGPAEFRGPGVHHNFDDSDSGYDVEENKSKPFGIGGYKGRIIFLGDGTEVLTESDDAEMFDNSEEDKDLASQVSKQPSEKDDDSSTPPPRAPSPPPRGNNKGQDVKPEQPATKDTPTETETESKTETQTAAQAESGSKEDPKKDEAGKPAASAETKA